MILEYFGMNRLPFNNDIPVESLYYGNEFKEAFARLKFAYQYNQCTILTAPVGAGKSTLLRVLDQDIRQKEGVLIYISDSKLKPWWLYRHIYTQLGGEGAYFRGDCKDVTIKRLKECKAGGTNVCVCIDEAHLLPKETLGEVRFLLNNDMDSHTTITLILSGQPEIKDTLRSDSCFDAIRQRVKLQCSIKNLTREGVKNYINKHLEYSGTKMENIFDDGAVLEIFLHSRGCPRLINNICTATLVRLCAQGGTSATRSIIADVIETEVLL